MSEEKKPSKKEQLLAQLDKARRTDPKKAVKILGLAFALVCIVIMSVFGFAIDPNFNFITWISSATFLLGIGLLGLLFGESMGADNLLARKGGLYQTSLINYGNVMKEIEPKMLYFLQWHDWFMPQELINKKVRILLEHGIDSVKAKNIVKYCTLKDVDNIIKHTIEVEDEKGNKILIRKVEEYQVDILKYVLGDEIKLNAPHASYYLTATGKGGRASVLERGNRLDKQINFNKKSNRVSKIVFSLGVSLIFGLFAVDAATGQGQAAMWVNLVTRITTLITSFCSGWSSSVTTVRLMAEKIENKTIVLKLFNYSLMNKEFKPQNEEELAKKEWEDYKKKEQKAKDNVITPEVIIALENKSTQIEQK